MESDYISREAVLKCVDEDGYRGEYNLGYPGHNVQFQELLKEIPAADVVKEENILKFYYVRSIDEYWIGRRLDTLYYARYEAENQQWVWTHSRYLPWGEHVVSPTSLWKEHTYPSEPEEISFTDWLKGFVKKHIAADVRPVVKAEWERPKGFTPRSWIFVCSKCGDRAYFPVPKYFPKGCGYSFCPNCGADMRPSANDQKEV